MEKTTFGIIPAGSGNGLVKSLLEKSGHVFAVLPAAYAIAKGRSFKLDITEMDLEYH